MTDEDDELLIRLHFGDLAPNEQADLRKRLAEDPALATRYEELGRCLDDQAAEEPLPDAVTALSAGEPSTEDSLADRTAHRVMAATMSPAADSGRSLSKRRFSFNEVVAIGVAAGLLGMLVMPAINASRSASARLQCQQNLKQLGDSLLAFAGDHGGRFPRIEPTANAGMFTVDLAAGYFDRAELHRTLVCPASELAQQVSARAVEVYVPTRAELRAHDRAWLDRVRPYMAGAYAYRMGYFEGVRYRTRRNLDACRAPLMADAPQFGADNVVVSRNHGSCGQNVLFEDGSVRFQSDCWTPADKDHLYLNNAGEVAAGHGPHDFVLGGSDATPGIIRVRYSGEPR